MIEKEKMNEKYFEGNIFSQKKWDEVFSKKHWYLIGKEIIKKQN